MILCPFPDCDGADPFVLKSRPGYKCRACLRKFTLTSHDSPWRCTKLPEEKRREIERLVEDGLSARQVGLRAGVNYRTAHYAVKRLRAFHAG